MWSAAGGRGGTQLLVFVGGSDGDWCKGLRPDGAASPNLSMSSSSAARGGGGDGNDGRARARRLLARDRLSGEGAPSVLPRRGAGGGVSAAADSKNELVLDPPGGGAELSAIGPLSRTALEPEAPGMPMAAVGPAPPVRVGPDGDVGGDMNGGGVVGRR